MNVKVLYYKDDRGSLLFRTIFVYLCRWQYMNVILLYMIIYECNLCVCIYIYCHLYFYHWNSLWIAWFHKKQTLYIEYVANAHGSWFLTKYAPPGVLTNQRFLHSKDGMEKKLTPRTRYWCECEPINLVMIMVMHDAITEWSLPRQLRR